MSNIEKLIADYNNAKNEMTKNIILAFKELLADYFLKYPDVDNISVIGYTPYFNDGDTCTYSHNTGKINGIDYKYDENEPFLDENGDYSDELYTAWYEKFRLSIDEFSRIVYKIPSKIFENSFEEGEIVFYRDSTIEILDYDHE